FDHSNLNARAEFRNVLDTSKRGDILEIGDFKYRRVNNGWQKLNKEDLLAGKDYTDGKFMTNEQVMGDYNLLKGKAKISTKADDLSKAEQREKVIELGLKNTREFDHSNLNARAEFRNVLDTSKRGDILEIGDFKYRRVNNGWQKLDKEDLLAGKDYTDGKFMTNEQVMGDYNLLKGKAIGQKGELIKTTSPELESLKTETGLQRFVDGTSYSGLDKPSFNKIAIDGRIFEVSPGDEITISGYGISGTEKNAIRIVNKDGSISSLGSGENITGEFFGVEKNGNIKIKMNDGEIKVVRADSYRIDDIKPYNKTDFENVPTKPQVLVEEGGEYLLGIDGKNPIKIKEGDNLRFVPYRGKDMLDVDGNPILRDGELGDFQFVRVIKEGDDLLKQPGSKVKVGDIVVKREGTPIVIKRETAFIPKPELKEGRFFWPPIIAGTMLAGSIAERLADQSDKTGTGFGVAPAVPTQPTAQPMAQQTPAMPTQPTSANNSQAKPKPTPVNNPQAKPTAEPIVQPTPAMPTQPTAQPIEKSEEEKNKSIDWVTLFKAVTRLNSDEFVSKAFEMGGHKHFGYDGRSGYEENFDDKTEATMYLDNGKYAIKFSKIDEDNVTYQIYKQKIYANEYAFGGTLEKEYDNQKSGKINLNKKINLDELLK
nr:hypothetical protein [Candidatus Gracilibacteria bacterium]